jgi:hypothetical protein
MHTTVSPLGQSVRMPLTRREDEANRLDSRLEFPVLLLQLELPCER